MVLPTAGVALLHQLTTEYPMDTPTDQPVTDKYSFETPFVCLFLFQVILGHVNTS